MAICVWQYVYGNMCKAICVWQYVQGNMCIAICARQYVYGNMCKAIFPQLLQDITALKQHTTGNLSKINIIKEEFDIQRIMCIVINSYNKTNKMH
jgi:hypothetical protein